MKIKGAVFLYLVAFAGSVLAAQVLTAQEVGLAIGEKIASRVSFYTLKGKRIGAAAVGKHPHELAVSRDARTIYSSDNGVLWMTDKGPGGNTISVIDIPQRIRKRVINLGKWHRPHGLGVLPKSGNLVATVENPDGLLLVNPRTGKILREYNTEGKAPHMVTVGPRGKWAYVSNSGSASVAAIRLATGKVILIHCDDHPQGGVISHNGKVLYVANSVDNTLSIIDLPDKRLVGTIHTGGGPGRVALTPDGTTLVYNLEQGKAIGFADVKTRRQIATVPLDGPPMSLSLSFHGKLAFTGVQSKDQVFIISVAQRRVVRMIHLPPGSGPDAVREVYLW